MREKILLNIILWGSVLAMFAPLLIVKESYFPYIIQRTLLLRALLEIIIIAYGILAIIFPKYRPNFKNPLNIAVLSFMGVMLVATVFSVSQFRSWWGNWERMFGTFNYLHYFLWYFALAGSLKVLKNWHQLFNASLLTSAIICGYAIAQRFNAGFVFAGGAARVDGTFGNAAFVATYTLFHLFIAGLLIVHVKNWWLKSAYLIVLILNALVLFLSGTRGALIGLVAALLVLPFLMLKTKYGSGRAFKIIIVFLIFLFVIWRGLFIFRDQNFIHNNYLLQRFTDFSLSDNTIQTRLHSWKWGMLGFRDNLLVGLGPENYHVAFNQYFTGDFYDYSGNEIWFDRAHNTLVDMASTMGIFGLLSYLGIFFVSGWLLINLKNRQKISSLEFLWLFLAMISYFIQNIFVFDSLSSLLIFHLLLAYFVFRNEEDLSFKNDARQKLYRRPIIARLAIILGIGLFSYLLFAVTMPEMKANKAVYRAYVAKVYNKYAEMMADYREARKYAVNKSDLGALISQSLNDLAYIDFKDIAKETKIADLREAINWLDWSIAREPKNMFFYYLQAKNYVLIFGLEPKKEYLDKGLAYAIAAHELSLGNIRPLWLLGQFYLFSGQTDKALFYLAEAEKVNPRLPETYFYRAVIHKYLKQENKMYEDYDMIIDNNFLFNSKEQIMEILPHYEQQTDKTRAIRLLQALYRLAGSADERQIISDHLKSITGE